VNDWIECASMIPVHMAYSIFRITLTRGFLRELYYSFTILLNNGTKIILLIE